MIPPHLSHLAILGITKETTAVALSILTVAHAHIQLALKQLNRPEQPARNDMEEALLHVDRVCRVLAPIAALTSQEHRVQVDAIEEAEGRIPQISGGTRVS